MPTSLSAADVPLVLDALLGLPGLLVASLAAIVVAWQAVTVVQASERYVRTDGDEVRAVLDPGMHFTRPFDGGEAVDVRTQALSLPVDVTTADDVDATVTANVEVRVADPAAAVVDTPDYGTGLGEDVSDYQIEVMERVGEAVTEYASARSWGALVDDPDALAGDLRDNLSAAFEHFGVELESVAVEDVEHESATTADDGDDGW